MEFEEHTDKMNPCMGIFPHQQKGFGIFCTTQIHILFVFLCGVEMHSRLPGSTIGNGKPQNTHLIFFQD